jgi:hypothetical protein
MVAGLMANYDPFRAPATAHIKNITPRVAALLENDQCLRVPGFVSGYDSS